ncbi:hypothetical protein Pmar_PMAR009069, partial [Perkinsus marinus ATCC 50983]
SSPINRNRSDTLVEKEEEGSGVFGGGANKEESRSRRSSGSYIQQQMPAKRMTLGASSTSRFAGLPS